MERNVQNPMHALNRPMTSDRLREELHFRVDTVDVIPDFAGFGTIFGDARSNRLPDTLQAFSATCRGLQ